MHKEEAFAPINRLKNLLLSIGFLTALVVTLLAFVSAKTISNPIQKLTRGTEIFGKGKLEHKIDVESEDEIGELAASFNRMAQDLLAQRQELMSKQEALRESEERYRSIVEHSADAINTTDNEGTLKGWNRASEKIFGYSTEEIVGKPFGILVPEGREDEAKQVLQRVDEEGFVRGYETKRKRKDGSLVDVELTVSSLAGLGHMAIVRDITERKRMEEEILNLKNFNQEIVEKSPLGIFRLDRDMRLIYENPVAKEIIGIPKGEESKAMGMDIREVPSVVAAGSSKEFDRLAEGEEVILEVPFKSIYGKEAILRMSGVPLYRRERFDGAILMIEDITERKQAEEEIQKAYRKLHMLYQIDRASAQSLELKEVLRNALDATLEALGVEGGGIFLLEPDGKTMTMRVHHGFSEEFVRNVQRIKLGEGISGKAVKEKKPVVLDVAEYPTERLAPFIAKEGLQTLASTPLLSAGEVLGALNLGTSRSRAFPPEELELLSSIGSQVGSAVLNAQLYRDLAHSYHELKSLDELKSNIIANVSHELRTPITVMKGALELVQDERDEAERKRLIAHARDALIRQNQTVGDLLETAAMEKGGYRVSFEAIELPELVSQVVGEFSTLTEGEKIDIDAELGRELPRVWADYRRLMHVLRNLVNNAIKFTGEGGKVTIAAREKEGMVEVCVSDTGIGIPKEVQERIFERLYQVDSSATRRYGGTGMGLSIAKEIVEAHGGEIRVESEGKDKGSTFCFTVPIAGEE